MWVGNVSPVKTAKNYGENQSRASWVFYYGEENSGKEPMDRKKNFKENERCAKKRAVKKEPKEAHKSLRARLRCPPVMGFDGEAFRELLFA